MLLKYWLRLVWVNTVRLKTMLEKKTTGELVDSYLYLLKKDIVIDYDKVWVSQESLIKELNELKCDCDYGECDDCKNNFIIDVIIDKLNEDDKK